jgi:AbrB family looped-hinge helix DNA binding protein
MRIVQVSNKGQILIPKYLRQKYGVKPGSRVQILEETEGLLVKPVPEDPIATACGFLEGDYSLTKDLIKEHRKESENEKANRA